MIAPLLANLSNKVHVVDNEVAGQPQLNDLVRLSEQFPEVLIAELDAAVAASGFGVEEFLLGALGRASARTFGVGVATVNGLTAVHPIRLCCATDREVNADQLLGDVRRALATRPTVENAPADLVFSYLGLLPDATFGPLQAVDGAALGVVTYPAGDVLNIDWWYDSRRLNFGTVEELTTQFFLGLIELTSEVTPRNRQVA